MTKREKLMAIALAAGAVIWWALRDKLAIPVGGHFPANTQKAVDLFNAAAVSAGLPTQWATDPALHYILHNESKGRVGIPNYQLRKAGLYPKKGDWPKAWALIKEVGNRRMSEGTNVPFPTSSSATGLGQLTALPIWKNGKLHKSNVQIFYPHGFDSLGVPLDEAIGMLRYIKSRYGNPAVARSMYGKTGSYVHAITGKTKHKGYKEGY